MGVVEERAVRGFDWAWARHTDPAAGHRARAAWPPGGLRHRSRARRRGLRCGGVLGRAAAAGAIRPASAGRARGGGLVVAALLRRAGRDLPRAARALRRRPARWGLLRRDELAGP